MSLARPFALCTTALLLFVILCFGFYSSAVSSTDYSNASNAINSAFVATYNAEKSGGNVTLLISQLNSALALVQRAQSENSSNPAQASADLQNATRIANLVASEASAVGQQGQSSLTIRNSESVAGAVVIVVFAALAYIYGGRLYRRVWLLLYRNYVVKPTRNDG